MNKPESDRLFYSCTRGNSLVKSLVAKPKYFLNKRVREIMMPYFCSMKKCLYIFSIIIIFTLFYTVAAAQCAMCTKTAQQLGEKPAQGLNSGILYLMLMPFAIVGFIGYRWWKNRVSTEDENINF